MRLIISLFLNILLIQNIYSQSNFGTWSSTDSLLTPRYAHAAVKLPDGKILVTGGTSWGFDLKSCEIFDPDTETWEEYPEMLEVRTYHKIILLDRNRILVVEDTTEIVARYWKLIEKNGDTLVR